MEIKIDFDEMVKLAENRDVSPRQLVLEYLDEVIKTSPEMEWAIQSELDGRGIFRCTTCGFWVPDEEMCEGLSHVCETCDEMSGFAI